jgi:methylglyoxal synthase
VLPPQASGAIGVVGDVVNIPLQPPLAVVVNNHAAKEASIAACVWHAASVLSTAQVNTTGGDGSTVNVAVQLVVVGAHELVYVHVTVVLPPQASGTIGVVGDVVNIPLQPPVAVVVSNHAAKDASIAAWVWHAASVLSTAQVNTTGGDGSTVNVAVHVVVIGVHELVYVQVTVVLPPQASGAIGVVGDVVNNPLQPPVAVAVVNHVAKEASIAACV